MIPEIDFLKHTYLFQDLDEEEISLISRIMTPREFQARETIMKEGARGDSMYIIAEGEVRINKALTMKFGEDDFRETEKVLDVIKAEDREVIGEMALASEAVRSATITAQSHCLLYEITRTDFLKLAKSNPDLGFKVAFRLAMLLSMRLKKSGEDVVRLTTALSIALSQ